jgi:Na+-transporting NADH:ubiquinone oxidoreductase subunit F
MVMDFLIGVGVACGITTVLALILVLIEATLGDYGEVQIVVNDRRTLTVPGGKPLLAVLKDQQVFIPSACGGRGSCGLCKVRVLEGGGDILSTELPWLTPEDRANGIRLSCQVKVRRNLRIRIPEELFSVRQFATEVVSLRDLTYDIKEVTLRLLDPPAIEFKAGQFVQVEVPEYDLTDEPVYRAYSISSSPADAGMVEMEIRLVPNGICTTYVHRVLKVGDRLTINGPYGDFYLRDSAGPIIFVAGGSGMAPVKSILLDLLAQKCPRPVRYFFGARTEKDLFLVDEMRAFEKQLPDFRFIPALSRPEPGSSWTGERGLITEVVARHLPDAGETEAYLCGSPGMIDACVALLKSKGIPDSRIFYDKFA